ncbi:MAG TPA: DUF916 domain-containing protein [Candidatus Paceibacterota bacterium]|nr:DUF916 domain-containing protein [Candidatus Paceibacterota bacterium]
MSGTRIGVLLASSVASLIFAFSLPLGVAAQTTGLEVKPAVIEDNVQPGQTYPFSVTITNISSSEQTYTVSTKDIEGLDENGQAIFAQPGQETSYSLSSWIVIPQQPITLEAGETRTVSFVAHVPTQTSPGAHFGGVFFNVAAGKTNGNGAGIGYEVGTVISLQIAGEAIDAERITQFSTDKILYSSPNVTLTTKVENRGNVLSRPHGLIEITDMFGKKVASITVNDNAAPVFPGSVRAYNTFWNDESLAIGRYQAVVSLSYGSDAKSTITAETSFWVIPLKLTAIVLGSLLALIILLVVSVRMYLRAQLRAMGVAKGDDMSFYQKRYGRSGSRIAWFILAVLLLCVILLIVLFVMFA